MLKDTNVATANETQILSLYITVRGASGRHSYSAPDALSPFMICQSHRGLRIIALLVFDSVFVKSEETFSFDWGNHRVDQRFRPRGLGGLEEPRFP